MMREDKKTDTTDVHAHEMNEGCCGSGDSCSTEKSNNPYLPAILSFTLLLAGMAMDYFKVPFFQGWVRLIWYVAAYIPVGFPVMKMGWNAILKGQFFTEFFLMTVATVGAFVLGEYPEGVTVMLFYAVGELFQDAAVSRAKGNIQALLDVRPKEARVFRNGEYVTVVPDKVKIGEKVQVRVGEKIPIDGILLSEKASLNTAAISGESKPTSAIKGAKVFEGSINLDGVVEVESSKEFKDSSIARILDMVQNATARKSKTELFIRKFARIYTPIVVYLAIALTLLPYFFVETYAFQDWLYRALVFLVISCPCALVISIPLGYFGGLGAASRNGILFKGASFLDTMTKLNTIAMDKTGTVTKGVFKIRDIVLHGNGQNESTITQNELMNYLAALESQSTHPIAKAIMDFHLKEDLGFSATEVTEVAGMGLKGTVNGKTVFAGNETLLTAHGIRVPDTALAIADSLVVIAIDDAFVGYVTIADELKDDAGQAVLEMEKTGVTNIIMLSGDTDAITQAVAKKLNIKNAKGGLLPEDKLNEVERLKKKPGATVAFVGDGINDAPVLAASDVGIAMGGLGSDVAIETADIIIQTDQPTKVAQAIEIAKSTRRIVWQNIALAFGVKAIVLLLGASGMATMWEAVFADVGVALLAILNAVRLQHMKWD